MPLEVKYVMWREFTQKNEICNLQLCCETKDHMYTSAKGITPQTPNIGCMCH